jgi:hypothetical protein
LRYIRSLAWPLSIKHRVDSTFMVDRWDDVDESIYALSTVPPY